MPDDNNTAPVETTDTEVDSNVAPSESTDSTPGDSNDSEGSSMPEDPTPPDAVEQGAAPEGAAEPTGPATPATAPHPAAVEMASAYPIPPGPFQDVPAMLYAFCMAIQGHELYAAPGEDQRYPAGTRSYFDNNPGNLKYRNQIDSTGEDKDGFAIFPDYETGFMALVRQVELACSGNSAAYKNPIWDASLKTWRPMNIMDFFAVYDSSYGDDPVAYATDVANELGVPTDTPINNLVAA